VRRGLQKNIGLLRKLFILMEKVQILIHILKGNDQAHLFCSDHKEIQRFGKPWFAFDLPLCMQKRSTCSIVWQAITLLKCIRSRLF
jgi:hypothetical protein